MVDRKLGRGLDFFLSSPGAIAAGLGEEVVQVSVAGLAPNPHQPRRALPEADLAQLADSIRSAGILQPILARRTPDGLQIIAGERRWRAARLAGLELVPAIVRNVTDEQAAILALVENLQREDLDPIEKARAFQHLQAFTKTTQDEIARQVGIDRSSVANFIRLLDLPRDVQEHVSRGTLSMGQARAILGLTLDADRSRVAEEAIKRRMSVREVEALVQRLKSSETNPGRTQSDRTGQPRSGIPSRAAWQEEIEDNLADSLGTEVRVKFRSKNSSITIQCRDRSEFERVYARLIGKDS
jgi:ParB family chromosome partitioning protein